MDDPIIIPGVSEMDFLLVTIISPNTSEKISELSCNMVLDITRNVENFSSRFRHLLTLGPHSSIFVPLPPSQKLYYDIFIIKNKKLIWGDSLGYEPFGPSTCTVLYVMNKAMEFLFPSEAWIIEWKDGGSYKYCTLHGLG